MRYLFQNDVISIRKMEDNITDYEFMTKWLSTVELLDYYEGYDNSFDLDKIIKKFTPRVKGEDEDKLSVEDGKVTLSDSKLQLLLGTYHITKVNPTL